jgi:hypothetical protein
MKIIHAVTIQIVIVVTLFIFFYLQGDLSFSKTALISVLGGIPLSIYMWKRNKIGINILLFMLNFAIIMIFLLLLPILIVIIMYLGSIFTH